MTQLKHRCHRTHLVWYHKTTSILRECGLQLYNLHVIWILQITLQWIKAFFGSLVQWRNPCGGKSARPRFNYRRFLPNFWTTIILASPSDGNDKYHVTVPLVASVLNWIETEGILYHFYISIQSLYEDGLRRRHLISQHKNGTDVQTIARVVSVCDDCSSSKYLLEDCSRPWTSHRPTGQEQHVALRIRQPC